MAIHLSDDKERGGNRVEFNKETQLLPIFGMTPEDSKEEKKEEKKNEADIYNSHPKELVDMICASVDVDPKSVLDMDCYLYDMNVWYFLFADSKQATLGGIHDEFVFSGKIDNLSMTYCGLTGFLQSIQNSHSDSIVRVLALYDHEEIGSGSLAGAESTSLRCMFNQISGERAASQAIRKSFLLSYVIKLSESKH